MVFPDITVRLKNAKKEQTSITCSSIVVIITGKLKNIIKELPEDFLVIHKSYVVNKQRIARYTYETVELDNGRVLTISQAQRKQVREKLLKEL